MFCKVCGNEVNSEAIFCTKCGCAIVEQKKIKNKEKENMKNSEIGFNVLKYISVGLVSLSFTFLLLAILTPYVRGNNYKISWSPNSTLSIFCVIFASLGLIVSIANFVLGFKSENKGKRFYSDVVFMLSILTYILSIVCIS